MISRKMLFPFSLLFSATFLLKLILPNFLDSVWIDEVKEGERILCSGEPNSVILLQKNERKIYKFFINSPDSFMH